MNNRKRKQGEGTLRLRNDGRWEGRVVIGYDDKDKHMAINVYTHTEEGREAKLAELIREMKIEIEKLKQGG
jgi:hypothetical protein